MGLGSPLMTVYEVSQNTWHTVTVALFSVGGATFIWTLVQSFLALRNNAESREDKVIGRLASFEQECRDQLEWERKSGVYWMQVAGIYAHDILQAGRPLPATPPQPQPPSKTPLSQ